MISESSRTVNQADQWPQTIKINQGLACHLQNHFEIMIRITTERQEKGAKLIFSVKKKAQQNFVKKKANTQCGEVQRTVSTPARLLKRCFTFLFTPLLVAPPCLRKISDTDDIPFAKPSSEITPMPLIDQMF